MLTGVLIPQILLIAFRKKLYDKPDARKIHKVGIPRLGGIAFFPAILIILLLTFGICRQWYPAVLDTVHGSTITALCFIGCAVVILYLVGMADDLIGLRYSAKFIAQIMAAVILVAGGLRLDDLHGFLGIGEMPMAVSVALTILITVFITNAINLIDGIDGLASGLSAIACALYAYIFYEYGLYIYGLMAVSTLGTLVSFFYFNVFGNSEKHGKIFMGDTGALTIGLLLSVFSIRICGIPDESLTVNPAVVAFAPLLIPCCDVVRVYLHRLKTHHNPFLPDKTHIHHKLLALGLSQQVAMPIIVLTSLALSAVNYWLSTIIDINILFLCDIVVWIAVNILLSRSIRRREHRLHKSLY